MKAMLGRILAVACVAVRVAAADGAEIFTLDDCLRIGMERSVRAANARRDRDIADALATQAAAEAKPRLGVSAGYTRLDEVQTFTMEDTEIEMGRLDNYEATASVSQMLYSGGRVGAALKAARLTRELAVATRTEAEAALTRDIKAAFYDVLLARAALDVRRESLAQLDGLQAAAEQKLRNGKASEFEALAAKVRTQNERPELIRASNACELAMQDFARVLGVETPFELTGSLSFQPLDPDPERTLATALSERPALLAAQATARLREQNVTASRSGTLPSLSSFFNYNGANSYRFASYSDDWEWHWNTGVRLEWTVWDGALTRGAVREKRLEFEKALADFEEARRTVAIDVRRALLGLGHAREAVAAAREALDLATRAMGIAKARYDAGLSTYLEFTDSNLALSGAGLSLSRALRDHLVAVADLEYASGLTAGELARRSVP